MAISTLIKLLHHMRLHQLNERRLPSAYSTGFLGVGVSNEKQAMAKTSPSCIVCHCPLVWQII